MKNYIILSLLLIIGITFNINKSYAIDPDCLQIVWGNDGETASNPDSVMVDICTDSPTYGQWYVKKNIKIGFKIYPFNEIPIQINEFKGWQDIDTNYLALREIFQNVELKYGDFTFHRVESDEEEHLISKIIFIEFDNYVCWDSLKKDIKTNNDYLNGVAIIPPIGLDVKEADNFTQIVNHGNSLEFNTNNLNIPHNIKIVSAYGNYFNTEYTIANEGIDIDISHLSTGVYFLLIDNIKPIKFIKY